MEGWGNALSLLSGAQKTLSQCELVFILQLPLWVNFGDME